MATEVLRPLAGYRPKTPQSSTSRQYSYDYFQQPHQRQADDEQYQQNPHGREKDVLSTILSDYGNMPSPQFTDARASGMTTTTVASGLSPSIQFGLASPSPKLELSSSLKFGESVGFPFYANSTSLREGHGESPHVEQKALDESCSLSNQLNTEATAAASTRVATSPQSKTTSSNKNSSNCNKRGELATIDDDTSLSFRSGGRELVTPDTSSKSFAATSSSARPASQGSPSKNVAERPLPPLPPSSSAGSENSPLPKNAGSSKTTITATNSIEAATAYTPLASSVGGFDLDAFPKPNHSRKTSAVTGPPLTALKRNKLSVSDSSAPSTHARSTPLAQQFRPRTSSLSPAANQRQQEIKHTRSKTQTAAESEGKPLPVPGMGNKASRAATGASSENDNVPSLPKTVFKRKPVQADHPSNQKSLATTTNATGSSYVEASASSRADSRISNMNKALPEPSTPSLASARSSRTKLKITSTEKGREESGEGITTDMIADAFPSPPKSRSSPDSTPQLLPPPSPVPQDSPSKYGLNKVDSIEKKGDESENDRKDDTSGKANMHVRGKSSTGLDIFRAAAAMTSTTKLSNLVGKSGNGLPANPRSRLDPIPQGLPTNPKTSNPSVSDKETFRPGPPLQLIDTNANMDKAAGNNPSPSTATDSEPSSSSQPNSATSSNKTFSSSTSTATCSTLTSPNFAAAVPTTASNELSSKPTSLLQEPKLTQLNGPLPPHPPQHIAPLQKTHLNCYQSHARFHLSHNAAAPMPCMGCFTDNTKDRWTCVWCALRICAGCKARLEKVPGRKIEFALTRLPGMDRAVAMGVVGGFGSGGKLGDWRVR